HGLCLQQRAEPLTVPDPFAGHWRSRGCVCRYPPLSAAWHYGLLLETCPRRPPRYAIRTVSAPHRSGQDWLSLLAGWLVGWPSPGAAGRGAGLDTSSHAAGAPPHRVWLAVVAADRRGAAEDGGVGGLWVWGAVPPGRAGGRGHRRRDRLEHCGTPGRGPV